jgi:hypothetical protein
MWKSTPSPSNIHFPGLGTALTYRLWNSTPSRDLHLFTAAAKNPQIELASFNSGTRAVQGETDFT